MEVQKCRVCGSNYHEYPDDVTNPRHEIYIRHLGFCDLDCYDKLSKKGQNFYKAYAYVYGDDLKRNQIPVTKRHLK